MHPVNVSTPGKCIKHPVNVSRQYYKAIKYHTHKNYVLPYLQAYENDLWTVCCQDSYETSSLASNNVVRII